MRKEFSETIEQIAIVNKKIVFLSGDLGFMALENIRDSIQDRFINVGVAEQNLISMAAGMASQGFIPICYSIAPFAVFRPAEQIRLDVCLHNLNVKIIGNGGGYGYGIMGATHHAIEDIAVLSSFQNIKCFIPFCNEDVYAVIAKMMSHYGPSYLRLGYGQKPIDLVLPEYSPIRKLSTGDKITLVSMGPVVLNALEALRSFDCNFADVFIVSEMPLTNINSEITESLKKTKRLLVIEEHVSRGGLGENIAVKILSIGLVCKFKHLYAVGYPGGLYGSQNFHQKQSGLDTTAIINSMKELSND